MLDIKIGVDENSVKRVIRNLELIKDNVHKRGIIKKCLNKAIIPVKGWIRTYISKIAGSSGRSAGRSIVKDMIYSISAWFGKSRKGIYKIHIGIVGDRFIYIAKKTGKRSFIPTAIEYGHITSKGTKTTPRPFMRPAKKSARREVINIFADELGKEIKALGINEHIAGNI